MCLGPGQTVWYNLKKMEKDTIGTYMEKRRSSCMVLVGKPEGKRSLGRPKHRWVDNVNMDVQEVGCET
jgi:hypothetical protein